MPPYLSQVRAELCREVSNPETTDSTDEIEFLLLHVDQNGDPRSRLPPEYHAGSLVDAIYTDLADDMTRQFVEHGPF